MKKKPWTFLILGFVLLIVPTTIYLCILVPQLSEEYNVLMASGGIIGGAGYFGASKISENFKYSSLYKTTVNTFTTLTIITIVEEFIIELVFLVAVFILSLVAYKICKELYYNAKRRLENAELAKEISQNIANSIK